MAQKSKPNAAPRGSAGVKNQERELTRAEVNRINRFFAPRGPLSVKSAL